MLNHLLLILGSVPLLVFGAEGLVRGARNLAQRLGISALVIGLTVVALGTNAPELVVNARAAASGHAVVGLGNVVGANISNVLLILGVAALVRPLRVRPQLLRREVPLLIGVTLLLVGLLWDRTLSRADGGVLVAGAALYLFVELGMARRREPLPTTGPEAAFVPHSAGAAALWIGGGLVALLVGAWFLLGSSVVVATHLGMSQVAIGLTVVALGTSLPELATSVVAARHGYHDVALGNAIGSSILNILLILGVTALIQPIEIEALRPLDMGVLVGSAVILVPILRSGRLISRWEGALLVAAYVGYLISLIP